MSDLNRAIDSAMMIRLPKELEGLVERLGATHMPSVLEVRPDKVIERHLVQPLTLPQPSPILETLRI